MSDESAHLHRLRRRLTAGRAKVVAAAVVIFLGGGAGGVTLAHGISPGNASGTSGDGTGARPG